MPSWTSFRLVIAGPLVVLGGLSLCAEKASAGPPKTQPSARSAAESPKRTALRDESRDKKKHDKEKPGAKKKKRRGSIPLSEPDHHHPSLSILKKTIVCPDDMVAVAGRVCVDRFESTLVEVTTHELLSPYYPPSVKLAAWSFDKWTTERDGEEEGSLAKTMLLPPLPDFEKATFQMKAMSWPGGTPSGYVSGELAGMACSATGKRLCNEAEWVTACRGERQTQYPYGQSYVHNACNVFREEHPAHVLHGEFSYGLSDPRLNQIAFDGQPLLRETGASPKCVSKWGDDGIVDMVGNLDEWIDDAEGTFVGGFYARATRSGCDARVRTHPINYFDYSTGVRCCKDPEPPSTELATQ